MVAGSNPVIPTNFSPRGVAQLVARYVRDVEVAGSSLVTPTKCGEGGCSKSIEQPFFIANFLVFFSRCKIFSLPLQPK